MGSLVLYSLIILTQLEKDERKDCLYVSKYTKNQGQGQWHEVSLRSFLEYTQYTHTVMLDTSCDHRWDVSNQTKDLPEQVQGGTK